MVAIAQGRTIAGKYLLERSLAQGGMGSVWVVRHQQLDALMAAKFMDTSLVSSPVARARFEREARAAAQLHSPHVVQVHDYGVEEGTPYLIMELLSGEDLGGRIRRVGRLSPAAVAEILLQVARALRRAHEAGIIHRDLKPGNVFITHNDDVEVVKVLDFGIAKATHLGAAGEEATKTGQILGSPHYMSPEQARRSTDVDHRTDLWALAAIAYRSLTGAHPFPADDIYELIMSICTDPVLPPSQHVPELGPEIDAFFDRAFAKDPAGRFQSARELASAFATAAGVKMTTSELSQSTPGMMVPSFASMPSPLGAEERTKPEPRAPASPPVEAASAPGVVSTRSGGDGQQAQPGPAEPFRSEGTLTHAPSVREPRGRMGAWGIAGVAVAAVALGGITAWRFFAPSAGGAVAAPTTAPSAAPPSAASAPAPAPAPLATSAASSAPSGAGASSAPDAPGVPRGPGPRPVPRGSASSSPKPPTTAPKPYDPLEHM